MSFKILESDCWGCNLRKYWQMDNLVYEIYICGGWRFIRVSWNFENFLILLKVLGVINFASGSYQTNLSWKFWILLYRFIYIIWLLHCSDCVYFIWEGECEIALHRFLFNRFYYFLSLCGKVWISLILILRYLRLIHLLSFGTSILIFSNISF